MPITAELLGTICSNAFIRTMCGKLGVYAMTRHQSESRLSSGTSKVTYDYRRTMVVSTHNSTAHLIELEESYYAADLVSSINKRFTEFL